MEGALDSSLGDLDSLCSGPEVLCDLRQNPSFICLFLDGEMIWKRALSCVKPGILPVTQ